MIPAVTAVEYVTDELRPGRRAFVGFRVTTPLGQKLIKAPSWATYRATTAGLRTTGS